MAVAAGVALIAAPAASAQEPAPPEACTIGGGGVSASTSCAPTGKARLLPTGIAVAPADAPWRVRRAIRFANKIIDKPYRYGGGHGLPWRLDTGYDCSGTISWALRGAKLLKSPLPSGSFRRWGVAGAGRWITIYYNGGHMYAVIAGLRLDTSQVPGDGPGWSEKVFFGPGYATRHAPGF